MSNLPCVTGREAIDAASWLDGWDCARETGPAWRLLALPKLVEAEPE